LRHDIPNGALRAHFYLWAKTYSVTGNAVSQITGMESQNALESFADGSQFRRREMELDYFAVRLLESAISTIHLKPSLLPL